MKYLVSIFHPAHVHFYRHVVDELESRGDDVLICARDKDVSVQLLRAFDLPHTVLASTGDSLSDLVVEQLRYEAKLLLAARRFDPDVMTSIGGLEVSHVVPFTGARAVVFDDSEPTPAHHITAMRYLDAIHTPRRFSADFGPRHHRYDGYHELAYLHPDRFTPDPDRLREHGVDPDDRYFVLRFVGWNAHHDVGQRGFSPAAKRRLVSELAELGDVYVTNEGTLPADLAEYETPVPPHVVHDLLYHADLYVGDSQTMATEAAILGTPAVRSNTFAAAESMSNFVELEDEYGLLHSIGDEDEAVATALTLARDPDAKATWRRRRERLLEEKIDVTEYVVDALATEARKAHRGRPARRASALGRVRALLTGGGSE